ncbi:MAG TPA: fumarylacetoacetate hydrolase family protein [Beijerinckiaceae bacterium]|jgi:2-keto-4-pentenoate hydratase/2-oxohepta-3-ene-1,7-dioic acid hydratase in catechol pathway
MKLVTFAVNGKTSWGAVVDGGVVDLGAKMKDVADVRALLAQGAMEQAKAALAGAKPDHALDAVTLLPPVPNPEKIICVGLNYDEHVRETAREKTEDPALFVRFANSQIGHGQAMLLPPESDKLDYEGEIAVVIGKGGRRIPQSRAYDHVAGFACYNDGSIRDLQWATTQWTTGKNFPATGAFGPWLSTVDEVPADSKLTLITRLNGQEMQRATTDMMVHSIPRLIAFISVFTELVPGDVIVTGTPGGVGGRKNPPLFMKDGDVCEIEIDRVGVLSNPIKAERV